MRQSILVIILLGVFIVIGGCTQPAPSHQAGSNNLTNSQYPVPGNSTPVKNSTETPDSSTHLFIYSNPSGALIYLDDIETGNRSEGHFLKVTPSPHRVILKLPGYYDSMQDIITDPRDPNLLNFPLIKIPEGRLILNSDPPGAAIYLDDTFTGKTTNDTLEGIIPGSHHIAIHRDGYSESERQVPVAAGQNVEITLPLAKIPDARGNISVVSSPKRIEIYLDGVPTGRMTDSVLQDIPAGLHTVGLRNPDYADIDRLVRVIPDQTVEVYIGQLDARAGLPKEEPTPDVTPVFSDDPGMAATSTAVLLNTTPSGAAIFWEGQNTGKTTNTTLYGGYWWKYIVYHLEGYFDSPHVIMTKPNTTTTISTPLVHATRGSVWVVSNPPGARISVDGIDTWKITPGIVNSIAPGPHTLMLSLPGYYSSSQEIGIGKGQTVMDYVPLTVDPASPVRPLPSTPVPSYTESAWVPEPVRLSAPFPEYPPVMMVYRVIPDDPEEKLGDMALKLNISGELEMNPYGWRIWTQDNRWLEIRPASGFIQCANFHGDYVTKPQGYTGTIADDGQAGIFCENYLKDLGLLPVDARIEPVEHGTAGNDTGVTKYFYVNFYRIINGTRSNDHIFMVITSFGELSQLRERWTKIEPYKEMTLISPKEAFRKLEGSQLRGTVDRVTLEYYSGSREEGSDYVLPAYVFRGTRPGKCSPEPFEYYVIATPLQDEPEVIAPSPW